METEVISWQAWVVLVRHLIIDIETDSLNINEAKVKVFGAYDLEEDKYYIIQYSKDKANQINEFLKNYNWYITFNGEEFDLPIMAKNGIHLPNKYNHIDLYVLVKYRRNTMLIKDGFHHFSLKEIIRTLKLDDVGKGDIDYKIFQKDAWTKAEQDLITKYLKQDLLLTAKLWKYIVDRFESFADFIPPKDVERYKHITTSSGAYAYKAICYMANIPENYNDIMGFEETYEGAYVSEPSVGDARGCILCFDFASLYPWMMIQGNLFSHTCLEGCENFKICDHQKWIGNELFTVKGKYCKRRLGRVEECIKKLYLLRKEYKKNKDKREQAVKILINSIYGISGSPKFASLYDLNTAGDCTGLGRQCIKYARKEFTKSGDQVLYSDTDSVYVKTEDKERTIQKAKEISIYLSNHFNFPHPEYFDLKLDEEIKYIQFFGKKKHYLYVTNENKLVVKGLQIIKRDTTRLSQKIFDELKPLIIEKLDCHFERYFILDLIRKYLHEDLSLAAKYFTIKNADRYTSKTSIQYTILQELGEGNHGLIKNERLGIGKGVKYCTIEQAKQLAFDEFDLDIFLDELEPFITQKKQGGGWFD